MNTGEKTLQGKTCLVTGASSGIGKATALALAGLGARVLLVNHHSQRGMAALDELRSRSGNPDIHLYLADLSSQVEIRRLANQIKAAEPQLHLLVNSAGSIFKQHQLTPEGIELTLATNYLSGYMLTRLLLDRLLAGAPARIINITSIAHWWGRPRNLMITQPGHYHPLAAYGDAKLAILLFTRELAHRLEGSGVTANCLHPGIASTGLVKRLFDNPIISRLADQVLMTPEACAENVLALATAPQAEKWNGVYFSGQKPGLCAPAANNAQLAHTLWDFSETITRPLPPLLLKE